MKNNYLIHWYEEDKIEEEWVEYDDWDDDFDDTGCYETVLIQGEQFFERLWGVTEQQVKEFVEKTKEEYRTDKIWYEII